MLQVVEQDIKDRLLFRQVIEALKCLETNVLRSVADGNIGSIMGIGAPAWTGGLIQFVNTYGLERFSARCAELGEPIRRSVRCTGDRWRENRCRRGIRLVLADKRRRRSGIVQSGAMCRPFLSPPAAVAYRSTSISNGPVVAIASFMA